VYNNNDYNSKNKHTSPHCVTGQGLGLARRGMLECDTLRHMNARQLHWIFKAMPQVQGMPGFILQ